MSNVVDAFTISSTAVRVALVSYSDTATEQFSLSQYTDKNSVKNAILATDFNDAGTTGNLYAALQYVQVNVSSKCII